MLKNNDWRLTDQMDYLFKADLLHMPYIKLSETLDHDHCEFCWYKIQESSELFYCTTDKNFWICEKCYNDFKDMFQWRVLDQQLEEVS